jgi:hypothetical protein
MNRGRVGEERGSKEMDGCPLTRSANWPTYLYSMDDNFRKSIFDILPNYALADPSCI